MAVRSRESKETIQTSSSTLRILYWIVQVLIARVNPLLDSFIFLALAFILSLAGHTYQDVYGTRQLLSTFQTRIMGRSQPSSRWNKTSGFVFFDDITQEENFWDYLENYLPDALYPPVPALGPQSMSKTARRGGAVNSFSLLAQKGSTTST
mmetsp:Transcript_26276/g.86346  ORF Transcript_26276/g.86346 Transcript_26276/m.86346 type:complete len:151 (-) Transcript_26276:1542-1994(-)